MAVRKTIVIKGLRKKRWKGYQYPGSIVQKQLCLGNWSIDMLKGYIDTKRDPRYVKDDV